MRLAFLLLSAAGLAAAQGDAIFHTDVQLVRILATVKDPSGALVGSLEKSDFTVRDNGVLQQISIFERQTDQPLSVAVLIDNSGSTAKDLKFETDSVTRFLRALLREGNPEDAVALYSFNWEIIKQNGFTRNVPAVERSLRALRGDAGTSLYDAILLASRDIEDRRGRKILVIVTDGGDTTSHSDFQRATEAAQLADAVIYPVLVIPIKNDAGRNTGGENALTTLSQRTGGRVFEPTLGIALDRAFDQILRDLRTQYLIAFYPRGIPPAKERFHTLDVALGNPEFSVKARNGYYGEAQQSTPARVDASSGPGSDSIRTPRKKTAQPDKRRNSQN
ncbi:MAG TPA: VWA domain-containing protein [Bryobacteraceae bacterium]|jgi:Ca-activated chloride channel family protein|nr:VWA domain-containing protein [Bryobacteraceae bacterium]